MRLAQGKNLGGLQVTLEKNLTEANLKEMTTAYNQLSYEIKKQAAYLYKVYGQSTREKILKTYKQPAELAKEKAIYPVSIYIEIDRLASALESGNEELANKSGNNINNWFEYIKDDAMYEALSQYFMDTVSPYLEEEISSFKPYQDFTFATGDYGINAFDAFGFYNKAGDESSSDAYAAGYIIKDEKGYFTEEGALIATYEHTGLPEIGTDKIQIIDSKDNKVVAEAEVSIVKGLPYISIDNGKLVDESGQDAPKPVVGRNYQFVPTKATDQNYDTIGDDANETLKLADFEGATYKSTNPQIFTVDANGKITAVASGKAKLKVTYNDTVYSLDVEVVAAN